MLFKRFIYFVLASFSVFAPFPFLLVRFCPYKGRVKCPIWSCPYHFKDNKYTFECNYEC